MKTKIHSLGSSGEGVGTLDNGMKVFVEGALVNEEIEFTLTSEKKTYAKGKLEYIIQPSAQRVKPICPLFGTCGGCHIMHLEYSAQLEIKRQRIIDAFERIGKIKHPVAATLASPMPLHYRNKIQLPQSDGKIGLYKKRSHEIIDVPKCYIHCEPGEQIYHWIRKHLNSKSLRTLYLRSAVFNEESVVTLITDGLENLSSFAEKLMAKFPRIVGVVENINREKTNVLLGKTFHTLAGRSHLFEKIGGKTFKISPTSFFQVNPWQAEVLFKKAIEMANITKSDHVLDPYTGVGTLALFASDHAKCVTGIECIHEAIENAKENAALNGATNCNFKVGHAQAQKADITLLNPPRKGCEASLLQQIHSKKIIYISCDPATLARDCALLKNYTIKTIQPIDLFPQTMHVETIVELHLKTL